MYLEKGGKMMNRNMNKRGQASMEFLMTYGWAILAAVLAIGVLGYYGVFSPGSSLPDTCIINPPMTCGEYKVNTTGVILIVQNGAGSGINVTNVSIPGCAENVQGINVADGSETNIYLHCATPPGSVGDKYDGDIVFQYLRSGKTIGESSTGDIRAGIQTA